MYLVFRVRAKSGFNRGDVICHLPDGHQFSNRELTNPDWRIIQCPLTQVEAEALTAQNDNYQRIWGVDFDSTVITQQSRDWFNDDTRTVPILQVGEDGCATLNATAYMRETL